MASVFYLLHALSWNVLFVCLIDQNPHNCKRASSVPLLKLCSRRKKPSTNFWFTGLTFSACTLHSHDLEESCRKSPKPPSTYCVWLEIWRRFKALLSCSMSKSISTRSSSAPDKVWMWRKVQLSQKQYPVYRILLVLDLHLQQQNKLIRDRWRVKTFDFYC